MQELFNIGEEPPEFFRMEKMSAHIPNYMDDCMKGHQHPLKIETDGYIKVEVGSMTMDMIMSSNTQLATQKLTELENSYVQEFSKRPNVQWAIYNSFDGLYISKEINYALLKINFSFAVYLKEENKTFWMLKFNGA